MCHVSVAFCRRRWFFIYRNLKVHERSNKEKKILILTRFEIHFRVDFLCENLKIFHRGSRNRTTWPVTWHVILCDWSFRTISFRFIFRIFIFSRYFLSISHRSPYIFVVIFRRGKRALKRRGVIGHWSIWQVKYVDTCQLWHASHNSAFFANFQFYALLQVSHGIEMSDISGLLGG